jgi:hypothetical protein
MKLLIIEGADNTGKDHLISVIEKNSQYKNVIKRHWGYPTGDSNEQKTLHQVSSFLNEFLLYNKVKDFQSLEEDTIMIWNRSHIGELVYGKLYRNSNPDRWVMQMEELAGIAENPNVYLIYLYADADFLANNDDGLSYSSSIDNKRLEQSLFMSAINSSSIKNVLKLKVNSGDSFIDETTLLDNVLDFIN